MFKAFDGHLEKSAKDGGFDLLANRALSRDVDSTLRSMLPGNERARLTVATNYFAIACPIMPIGLLGAFLMLDKLENSYEQKAESKLKANEAAKQDGEVTEAMYLASMKQKAENEKKKLGMMSRPIEGLLPGHNKKFDSKLDAKRREASLMLGGKPSEQLERPVLLSKPQTENIAPPGPKILPDIAPVLKTKTMLEAHLDKMTDEGAEFGALCGISAKIDVLEKVLKRLGC